MSPTALVRFHYLEQTERNYKHKHLFKPADRFGLWSALNGPIWVYYEAEKSRETLRTHILPTDDVPSTQNESVEWKTLYCIEAAPKCQHCPQNVCCVTGNASPPLVTILMIQIQSQSYVNLCLVLIA